MIVKCQGKLKIFSMYFVVVWILFPISKFVKFRSWQQLKFTLRGCWAYKLFS